MNKCKGRSRRSYSDYCQIKDYRIPDFNKWHQNEVHKLKLIEIIKDFDPDNIRYTDLFIFKSHFQQVECVQRLKKVIDEGLKELFKLEIFIELQLQRNKHGQDTHSDFLYKTLDMKLNKKLDYYESMYDVEIEQYFNRHKDTQIYKSYMESNTKILEQFMNYLNNTVEQTESQIIKLQEKRRIWVKEEPVPKERTQWQFYNPFAYLIPEMDQFLNNVEENDKIQSKADKAIQLTKQGYQSYKDGKYDDAVQKFDASLICNPQLQYAYIGKAITLSLIYQSDEKRVDQQKIVKAFDKAIELEQKNFVFQLNRLIFYHNNRMRTNYLETLSEMQNTFSQQQQQDYFQFQQLVDMIYCCPYRDDPKNQLNESNGLISDSDSDSDF